MGDIQLAGAVAKYKWGKTSLVIRQLNDAELYTNMHHLEDIPV